MASISGTERAMIRPGMVVAGEARSGMEREENRTGGRTGREVDGGQQMYIFSQEGGFPGSGRRRSRRDLPCPCAGAVAGAMWRLTKVC